HATFSAQGFRARLLAIGCAPLSKKSPFPKPLAPSPSARDSAANLPAAPFPPIPGRVAPFGQLCHAGIPAQNCAQRGRGTAPARIQPLWSFLEDVSLLSRWKECQLAEKANPGRCVPK